MQVIFEPVEPRKIGPFTLHGLFLRRQPEVADVYSKIIADDIVTLGNIGDQLLHGPRSDRTRQMLETALRPAVDRATGRARSAVRVAMGTREYDAIRESVAAEAVEYTMTPLTDPEFNRRQSAAVRGLIAERMREMPSSRLRRDAALGDQGGRVDALRARRGARASAPAWSTWRSSESEGMSDGAPDARTDSSVIDALPGLLRIAAGAWWRTAEWTLGASGRVTSRLVRAASSGESGADLLEDIGTEIRAFARDVLGIDDLDQRVPDVVAQAVPGWSKQDDGVAEAKAVSLRERGAELLRQSADVRHPEEAHPAYGRILGDLAPDEGRILRLLATEGPQPAVDVRAGKGLVPGSQLVAPGLSMIGAHAGCRDLDRVPAYLNNLFRLGLIWFSREPFEDRVRYQVLEAQPDVLAAMREGRARTVRRSIHLTPFGADFCETCLPLHTAELDALPGSAASENGET